MQPYDSDTDPSSLQEIIKALLRVFDNEFQHALHDEVSISYAETGRRRKTLGTNLRHNRLSIASRHVTERHLRALVLIDLDFRVVDEGNFLHRC